MVWWDGTITCQALRNVTYTRGAHKPIAIFDNLDDILTFLPNISIFLLASANIALLLSPLQTCLRLILSVKFTHIINRPSIEYYSALGNVNIVPNAANAYWIQSKTYPVRAYSSQAISRPRRQIAEYHQYLSTQFKPQCQDIVLPVNPLLTPSMQHMIRKTKLVAVANALPPQFSFRSFIYAAVLRFPDRLVVTKAQILKLVFCHKISSIHNTHQQDPKNKKKNRPTYPSGKSDMPLRCSCIRGHSSLSSSSCIRDSFASQLCILL
jgi:hypothetical protein